MSFGRVSDGYPLSEQLQQLSMKGRIHFEALKNRSAGIKKWLTTYIQNFETNYDTQCTLRRLHELKNLFEKEPLKLEHSVKLLTPKEELDLKEAIKNQKITLQEVLMEITTLEKYLLAMLRQRMHHFDRLPVMKTADYVEDPAVPGLMYQSTLNEYTLLNCLNFLKWITDSPEKVALQHTLKKLEKKINSVEQVEPLAELSDSDDELSSDSDLAEEVIAPVLSSEKPVLINTVTAVEEMAVPSDDSILPQKENLHVKTHSTISLTHNANPASHNPETGWWRKVGNVLIGMGIGAGIGLCVGILFSLLTGFISIPICITIGAVIGTGVGCKGIRSHSIPTAILRSPINRDKISSNNVNNLESTSQILKTPGFSGIHNMDQSPIPSIVPLASIRVQVEEKKVGLDLKPTNANPGYVQSYHATLRS